MINESLCMSFLCIKIESVKYTSSGDVCVLFFVFVNIQMNTNFK